MIKPGQNKDFHASRKQSPPRPRQKTGWHVFFRSNDGKSFKGDGFSLVGGGLCCPLCGIEKPKGKKSQRLPRGDSTKKYNY